MLSYQRQNFGAEGAALLLDCPKFPQKKDAAVTELPRLLLSRKTVVHAATSALQLWSQRPTRVHLLLDMFMLDLQLGHTKLSRVFEIAELLRSAYLFLRFQ